MKLVFRQTIEPWGLNHPDSYPKYMPPYGLLVGPVYQVAFFSYSLPPKEERKTNAENYTYACVRMMHGTHSQLSSSSGWNTLDVFLHFPFVKMTGFDVYVCAYRMPMSRDAWDLQSSGCFVSHWMCLWLGRSCMSVRYLYCSTVADDRMSWTNPWSVVGVQHQIQSKILSNKSIDFWKYMYIIIVVHAFLSISMEMKLSFYWPSSFSW